MRLRLDVDDPEDITVAMAFGLGSATAATLLRARGAAPTG